MGKTAGSRDEGGETLDTQAGERYDGGKETELGGRKDGRGEEAGRLDAGVEESGGRYDREALWYQAQGADAGGGSKSERDSAFVARVLAEGKTVKGEGQRRYAYRLTAEEKTTREALEAGGTVLSSYSVRDGVRDGKQDKRTVPLSPTLIPIEITLGEDGHPLIKLLEVGQNGN